jgi:hypothetical protein
MKTVRILSVLVCCVWPAMTLLGAESTEKQTLDPQLEPFRPLLEKTWKGEFKNSAPDKPVVDVMRWERALNGKAVRVLHSINDGAYGGETIFRWDEKEQKLTYHYFTTAGFMTIGRVKSEGGKLVTHEVVEGSTGGVTEVRATSQLLDDGTFRVKSEHLKEGKWMLGRDVTYREDAAAKVIFK